MQIIAQWIVRTNVPPPQHLDETAKDALKNVAKLFLDQESKQRHATERQYDATWDLVLQCIDRGECYSKELVHADISDTLSELRPDIQIGNEVLWAKLKNLFNTIGTYLSKKFDDLHTTFIILNSLAISPALSTVDKSYPKQKETSSIGMTILY